MGKKSELADLRVYLDEAESLYRAVSLSVRRTSQTRPGEYEVYFENFNDVLRGKDSLHSSGRMISRSNVTRREMYEWTVRVATTTRLSRIAGIALGSARWADTSNLDFPRTGPSGKHDKRISVIIPAPPFQHGYEVFAVPAAQSETIANLRALVPYDRSTIAASLVADWLDPAIVLVAWVATEPTIYEVSETYRADTQSRRFAVRPAAYSGTWVQRQIGSPDDDVLIYGFPHRAWPAGKPDDPKNYYFARDGRGIVDRVAVRSTITQEEADALLATRD